MAVQLSSYIAWPAFMHTVGLPKVYKCPNDTGTGNLANSYEPYYVQRKRLLQFWVLGPWGARGTTMPRMRLSICSESIPRSGQRRGR